MQFFCFTIFLALPLLAFGVATVSALRARWRPAWMALLAATPLTAVAVLAPASVWTVELAWLRAHAWAAPVAAAAVFFVTSRLAFRQGAEEHYDLDRHERFERCAMGFLGAGLLELAFAAILVVAALAAG